MRHQSQNLGTFPGSLAALFVTPSSMVGFIRSPIVITSMPEYVALFKTAFPNDKYPVTYDNMALAIGAFERGLVTPSR